MQKGFSLVELMVSLVIGMIIMLGVATFIGMYTKNSADSISRSAFETNFKGALLLLERDIPRAGYWAKSNEQIGKGMVITDNPFKALKVETDCVLYSYDFNKNGTVEVQERHGFYFFEEVLYYLDVPPHVEDIGKEEEPACSIKSGSFAKYWTSLIDEKQTRLEKVTFALSTQEHKFNDMTLIERTLTVDLVGYLKAKSALKNAYTSVIKLPNHEISANL